MVQQSGVRFLHELASRGVESKVVEAVEGSLASIGTVGIAIGKLGLALAVITVGSIQGLCVAVNGVVPIDVGVLAGQVGLVKVIGVLHVGASQAGLHNNRGIRADQHSHGTGTARRTSIALGVQSNIASNDNGITAVPGRGFYPVDTVEQGVGTAVASIDGVDAFEVGIVTEQLHQNRLDRLGLVQNGLGANLQATNRVGVDVVLLEQVRGDGKGKRVNV